MTAADTQVVLGRVGVVPVIRTESADEAVTVADDLVAGGLAVIEITYTTPDAGAVIRELAGNEGVVVGAGTITTPAQLDDAVAAGAAFVVSPVNPPFFVPAAVEAGVLAVPGCATPTEMWAAVAAGARTVKAFPAVSLGGPGFLTDVLAPLPDLQVMPSGGIAIDDVPAYLTAGAWCVGIGGPLTGPMEPAERRARAGRAAASGGGTSGAGP